MPSGEFAGYLLTGPLDDGGGPLLVGPGSGPTWIGDAPEVVGPGPGGEPVYTPVVSATTEPPYVGFGSVARSRSGVDPHASTIRARDHDHHEG